MNEQYLSDTRRHGPRISVAATRIRGAILLLGLVVAGSARGDVYVRTDAQGVAHYTNQAGLNGYKRIVAVLKEEGRRNQAHAEPIPGNVARYAPQIRKAAREFKVDQALLYALITVESGFNPRAVSKVGARGLMQIMPDTAKRYGVGDPFNPAQNIRGGTHYLRDLLDRFGQNARLALAAYNAGEKAVMRYGNTVPPYPETRAYVPKVMALYDRFRKAL